MCLRACVCMGVLRAVGLSFSVSANLTMWRCGSQQTYSATVKQIGTIFVANTVGYIHPPTVGGVAAVNLSKDLKDKLKDNVFL